MFRLPNGEFIKASFALVLCACLCVAYAPPSCGQQTAEAQDRHAVEVSDPYELSFDDFEWSEPIDSRPIEGARDVGRPIDYVAAIANYKARAGDAKDASAQAANLTVLGKLLLRKAKTEDDLPAYAESESVLRQAVSLVDDYQPAKLALAQTLMARHGFKEALRIVKALDSEQPNHPATLAVLFDCELELGNLSKAEVILDRLLQVENSAPVLARAARLAELRGEHQQAVKLIVEAITDLHDRGVPNAEFAWYHWRIGTISFDSGELESAEKHFRKALDLSPEDEASLVGLARTQFAQGKPVEAIVSLRKAAVGEAPPVLALLGDMLADQGDLASAQELWDRCESLMREEAKVAKTAHAREVAMFYADHSRNAREAVALSKLDLDQREDAFARDCHAWALLKNEQVSEAASAIRKALELVPNDNQILFHAAEIFHAAGDLRLANAYARKIRNPRFSVVYYNQLQRYLQ